MGALLRIGAAPAFTCGRARPQPSSRRRASSARCVSCVPVAVRVGGRTPRPFVATRRPFVLPVGGDDAWLLGAFVFPEVWPLPPETGGCLVGVNEASPLMLLDSFRLGQAHA